MEYHVKAWQEVYASFNRYRSREEILLHEGALDLKEWYNSLHDTPLSDPTHPEELAAAYEFMRIQGRRQRAILLSKYLPEIKPYPDALPVLRSLLRLNIPCALVTSSSRITVQEIVPQALRDCFQIIIAAEDVPRHKPDPTPYLAAAENLQVRPQESLVVENSPGGIQSGLAAGAVCAAISSTLPAPVLRQAAAVYPSLRDLAVAQGWTA
jgi:HAD superfamily hydrolase (TIGR01509 family)